MNPDFPSRWGVRDSYGYNDGHDDSYYLTKEEATQQAISLCWDCNESWGSGREIRIECTPAYSRMAEAAAVYRGPPRVAPSPPYDWEALDDEEFSEEMILRSA